MKNNITLAALLLLFVVIFSGCEKKKEWNYRYGYTVDDIAGSYTYSNIESSFDQLTENQYCHICTDAEINITKLTDQTIKFKINCPDENFSREWVGKPSKTSNDFMLHMSSGYMIRGGRTRFKAYNLTGYVYQNEAQNIRVHGFASFCKYELQYPLAPDSSFVDTALIQATNYYFDMIKD